MLIVAYPPPRPWWAFWRPAHRFLLREGRHYRVRPDGRTEVFAKPGYEYVVAYAAPTPRETASENPGMAAALDSVRLAKEMRPRPERLIADPDFA